MLKTNYIDLDRIIERSNSESFIAIGSIDRELELDLIFNLAYNMSITSSKSVGMFNVLTSNEKAVCNLVTLDSCIDFEKFVKGQCTAEECKKIEESINKLGKAKIFLEDSVALVSLEEFKDKCKSLKEKCDVDVIFIDSIQMIRLDNLYNNLQDSKESIIRELKLLATELKITIISIFNLNENVSKRMDKTPLLTDFIEGIEDYAKIILGIYKDNENSNIIHYRNVINMNEAKNEYSLCHISKSHKIANIEKIKF